MILNFSEKIFMDFHDFFWYDAYIKNKCLYSNKIKEIDINNLNNSDNIYINLNETYYLFKFYDNKFMKYYII
jgi:hypothetical protein